MMFCNVNTSCVFFGLLIFNVAFCSAEKGCTAAELAQENLRKLAVANNELALKLYQRLASSSTDNMFFSPFSLSTAFGMLFYGTKGDTAKELRTVLGYEKADLSSELVHSSFHRFLTDSLYAKDSKYTLDLANSILLNKHLEFVPNYKSEVQNLYQAIVEDVDFLRDGSNIVNKINQWVKEQTHGKIDHLLDELSPSTIMVLLNAVYFKGTWKTQFDPEMTFPRRFYNGGLESEAKSVPVMHTEDKYPYAEFEDLKALELPYKGEDISMVVLLPNHRNGLADLERSLTLGKLSTIHQQLHSTEVIVALPKFKIQYSQELSSDFQALGAKHIFNAGMADFSGMTSSKNVFVSEVLHKAVIEVNEEGSEAAAITGIVTNRMGSNKPEFIADHPFLFAIVDKRSDMVLFVGRVNNL